MRTGTSHGVSMAAARPATQTAEQLFKKRVLLRDAMKARPTMTDLPAKYLEFSRAVGMRAVPWDIHFVDKANVWLLVPPLLGRTVRHIRTAADIESLRGSLAGETPDTILFVRYDSLGESGLEDLWTCTGRVIQAECAIVLGSTNDFGSRPVPTDEARAVAQWKWSATHRDYVDMNDKSRPAWSTFWASKPLFLTQMGARPAVHPPEDPSE